MSAKRLDITIEQGADYDRPFRMTDQGGNPVDLTGYTAAMQVRVAVGFPTALLTLTTENGGIEIDARDGEIRPVISEITTAVLLPGTYVYDVKLRDNAGRTTRPFQGTVTVSPEVTVIPVPAPAPSPAPSGGALIFSNPANSAYAAII